MKTVFLRIAEGKGNSSRKKLCAGGGKIRLFSVCWFCGLPRAPYRDLRKFNGSAVCRALFHTLTCAPLCLGVSRSKGGLMIMLVAPVRRPRGGCVFRDVPSCMNQLKFCRTPGCLAECDGCREARLTDTLLCVVVQTSRFISLTDAPQGGTEALRERTGRSLLVVSV